MKNSIPFTPVRISLKKSQCLDIDWSDGLQSHFELRFLRRMCPCASCQGERDLLGRTLLPVVKTTWDGSITALDVETVGNYALRIIWSDQHRSGIYPYTYLREFGQ
ncbi:MAG: gamma-butyrobetaine hydroxylase-like domain-containing protein [Phycisphaerae bacterium]